MQFSQDLSKGTIVPIVLALLSEQPMYGYEIVKVVNARTNGRLEWREGTLYPTLHQLEAAGLVRAAWEDVATAGKVKGAEAPGGRRRRYYHITPKGQAELGRRAEEWREFSSAVNAFFTGA